ncbi:sigma-54 dependent transcriptional regulator [Methylophaga sp.]|jgi:transcriptional regulator with PAS, ATPase and Fis domain|uniref:sigma-54 interaction domain-containing protein n=1 Tax=Methylophaga sp. TaxID=2024840 RepID=UPI001401434C|nr:sigma-54 dependent transcriptional regulator [Methylophaga sp.]MTI63070.1 sigma-54-dependent Fis family transcriptional regulator [Methylophaga sp.]
MTSNITHLSSQTEPHLAEHFAGRFGMLGQSPAMQALFEQIEVVAKAQGPVMISGESGTGKELVAQALHQQSERAEGPFVVVNCAGIPGELLEAEFFGHTRGAFTGASEARPGMLQQANGGSLFLDEISDMPISLQAKLLRALQDGAVRPVGRNQEDHVNVRIIAATHDNLRKKIARGEFRKDLFYRLDTFQIQIPALRERGDDKLLLARNFLDTYCREQDKPVLGLSEEARQLLLDYHFPGNVRELQNLIERAVAFCDSDQIETAHLLPGIRQSQTPVSAHADEQALLTGSGMPTMHELQSRYLKMVLSEVNDNKQRAAEILGIGRRTLYRWLQQGK